MNKKKNNLLIICVIRIGLTIIPECILSQVPKCPLPSLLPGNICNYQPVKGKFYIKDVVRDFGADPTGRINAQNAFECAANFFNINGGNGQLIIPYGVYLIGLQVFIMPNAGNCPYWTDFGWVGRNLMHMVDCKNFEIVGVANAKSKKFPLFKFENKLKMGGFKENGDPSSYKHYVDTQARYLLPLNCTESKQNDTYLACIGSVFYLENCNGIKISGIELDGNYENYSFGSFVGTGPFPFENWSHGLVIWNSKNVQVKKVAIHDIGCDGILIRNFTDNGTKTAFQNVILDSINISKSGRNNISWVGGRGLIIKNSTLSHASSGRIKTNPGASIDIEPEIHEKKTSRCEYILQNGKPIIVYDYCADATFSNLNISEDRLYGLLNAGTFNYTKNVKIINSKVKNISGLSYYSVAQNKIQIENCSFSGEWNINQKHNVQITNEPTIKKSVFKTSKTPK